MTKKSDKAPSRRLEVEESALEGRGGSKMPASPARAPIVSNDQEHEHLDRPTLERPLTIAEVAVHYRVSERTIRRRISKGTLQKEPGFDRTVRISVEQLRMSGINRKTKP